MKKLKTKKEKPKIKIPKLKFDQNGLIPAIVQDIKTGDVLMVAYMNKQALKMSLKEKRTCFYSRSRKTLWRKGETSGNTQKIKVLRYNLQIVVPQLCAPMCPQQTFPM